MVDADDEVVEELERFEGREPEPLQTTLDPAVQAAVEAALGDTTTPTAVVVVDRKSNVRAVASRPLGEFNRALGGEYPPGSTFKVVTTAALLAAASRRTRRSSAPRRSTPAGGSSRTSRAPASGTVPFGLAFAQSCNTAFISASAGRARRRPGGRGRELRVQRRLLGRAGHGGGSFPTPADATEHAAAAIGQGRVTASPLHMATVGATVIDGTWEPPVLLPDARRRRRRRRPPRWPPARPTRSTG